MERYRTFVCVWSVFDVSDIADMVTVRTCRPQGRTSICAFSAGVLSVLADTAVAVKRDGHCQKEDGLGYLQENRGERRM